MNYILPIALGAGALFLFTKKKNKKSSKSDVTKLCAIHKDLVNSKKFDEIIKNNILINPDNPFFVIQDSFKEIAPNCTFPAENVSLPKSEAIVSGFYYLIIASRLVDPIFYAQYGLPYPPFYDSINIEWSPLSFDEYVAQLDFIGAWMTKNGVTIPDIEKVKEQVGLTGNFP